MAFYRIKDAADKIGVQPHVLRFWETQFPSLKAPKSTRGQRLYTDEDVENYLKIKILLYNEGFSIPGAKKILKEQKQGSSSLIHENSVNKAESLVQQTLEKDLCRDLLKELKELRDFVQAF